MYQLARACLRHRGHLEVQPVALPLALGRRAGRQVIGDPADAARDPAVRFLGAETVGQVDDERLSHKGTH